MEDLALNGNPDDYIILTGFTLEKREDKIFRSISKDRDIKKFIKRGRLITWKKVGEIIGIILVFNIPNFFLDKLFPEYGNLWYIWLVISIVAVVIYEFYIIHRIVENMWKYLNYIRSKKSPRNSFEIWRPVTSAMSDAHNTLALAKILGSNKVKMAYARDPYSDTIFIDSITLRFDFTSVNIKKNFNRLFDIYAIKTFDSMNNYAEEADSFFDKDGTRVSWEVFGIKFFSEFIYNVYKEVNEEFINKVILENARKDANNKPFKDKKIDNLYITLNQSSKFPKFTFMPDKNLMDNLEKKYGRKGYDLKNVKKLINIALEYIKMCTAPEFAEIVEQEGDNYKEIVYITDIEVNGPEYEPNKEYLKSKKHLKIFKNKNEVRIPVKRWISVPNLAKKPFQNSNDRVNIMTIGGAEHNLNLLYFLNSYRWEKGMGRNLGIAENRFDLELYNNGHSIPFILIGAESSVYFMEEKNLLHKAGTITTSLKTGFSHSDEAKIIQFTSNIHGKSYYITSFYGLSSPMINISFARYILDGIDYKDEKLHIYESKVNDLHKFLSCIWDREDFINYLPLKNNPNFIDLLKKNVTLEEVYYEDDCIIAYNGFKAEVEDGRIKQITLGSPFWIKLNDYNAIFKNYENEFDQVIKEIKEAIKNNKKKNFDFHGIIGYGGGHLVLLKISGVPYACFVIRTDDAIRDPNLIDIGAGLGDSEFPVETMISEAMEEFLIYKIDDQKTVTAIIPDFKNNQKYIEVARNASKAIFQKLNIKVEKEMGWDAEIIPLPNSPKISVNNKEFFAGVFFGEKRLEFVNVLKMTTDTENIGEIVFKDGEFSGTKYLGRKTLVVNLNNGKCMVFRNGKKENDTSLDNILPRNSMGRVATIKVAEIIKNWNFAWGNSSYLQELTKGWDL